MPEMSFPTTAKAIGQILGAEILGDFNRVIETLAPINAPRVGALIFLSEKKYAPLLGKITGATLLTTQELVAHETEGGGTPNTFLVVDNPKLSFAKVATYLMPKIPYNCVS